MMWITFDGHMINARLTWVSNGAMVHIRWLMREMRVNKGVIRGQQKVSRKLMRVIGG